MTATRPLSVPPIGPDESVNDYERRVFGLARDERNHGAAQGALEDAGYRVDWLGTAPSGYGVRLRVTALED